MKIFYYDESSKEFLSEGFAQENPVKKGSFLFPPNSTTIVPPAIKQNETIVFNGDFWEIVPDYRGQKQINILSDEISFVDEIGKLKPNCILFSDFMNSDRYDKYLLKQKAIVEKNSILEQINVLDMKRIRALCEPAIKDDDGKSWLEYYNSKIAELRNRLKEVTYDS